MSDFLMLPGMTASWAIPVQCITDIGEFHDDIEGGICDASELLGFDRGAAPRRIVHIRNQRGEFGLLAFGHAQVASPQPSEVLALPPLLRCDPAGRLACSVIALEGVARAWVLDVDQLERAGGSS